MDSFKLTLPSLLNYAPMGTKGSSHNAFGDVNRKYNVAVESITMLWSTTCGLSPFTGLN